jgi:chaperone required for assembly of F1-ATPase
MTDPRPDPTRDLRTVLAAAQARPKPKRFYRAVDVASGDLAGWRVILDGRVARTPKKRPLEVGSEPLARALAIEWEAQAVEIDPATMPLTTLVCTAIDTVAESAAAVGDEIAAYAMSDLLCYRAEGPAGLVARQATHWDPVLDWAATSFGVRWRVGAGLMPVAQDVQARVAVRDALGELTPLRLAGLHVLTTLSGSALLALAHLRGRLSLDEVWIAAHVDEDWQISLWGEDNEATARRAQRRRDAEAAALVVRVG